MKIDCRQDKVTFISILKFFIAIDNNTYFFIFHYRSKESFSPLDPVLGHLFIKKIQDA